MKANNILFEEFKFKCIVKLLILTSFWVVTILGCKKPTEPDTEPPMVTITFPTDGSTVSEIVTITAVALDNKFIEKVSLLVDGLPVEGSDDYTEPYQLRWNTASQPDNSSHTIIVRAIDGSGNLADSDLITLVVDNSGTRPSKIELAAIEFLIDSFVIDWSPSLNGDFNSYSLYQGFTENMADESIIFSSSSRNDTTFTVTGVIENEIRYYRLAVSDTTGLVTLSSIKRGSSFDEEPPVVTITSPSTGETVAEIVNISVSATDNRGIANVNLWIDGSSIQGIEDTDEPFELQWNTAQIQDGTTHKITVKAFDTSDNETESSPIFLIVDNSNFRPTRIELNTILYQNDSFIINWSQSTDNDFDSYTLYEAFEPGMAEKSIVFSTKNKDQTLYTVTGVSGSEMRYYQLKVTDIVGLHTSSSIKPASTYLPTEELVAYYPFNDDANDKSGNGHHVWLFGPTFAAGAIGSSLAFDGDNDYAEIPHSSAFDMDKKTISFWLLQDQGFIEDTPGLVDVEGVLNKIPDTGPDRPFSFGISNQSPPFDIYTQTGHGSNSLIRVRKTDAISAFEWYHVVGTWDNNDIFLYLNGVKVASAPFTGTIVHNTYPITLGKPSATSTRQTRFLNGKIDELLFYNRVLTEEEVQSLYEIARP